MSKLNTLSVHSVLRSLENKGAGNKEELVTVLVLTFS